MTLVVRCIPGEQHARGNRQLVTGIDIVPNLVGQARVRARSEGVEVQFDEGDADALPYEDGSFDLVMSMWGAMFAPRPDVVTHELTRVCRSGGQIAMANWTPGGFIGRDVQGGCKTRASAR
jgi:ubiquinone/menaquinone biosynthesis C-methylase UbiE